MRTSRNEKGRTGARRLTPISAQVIRRKVQANW
jgi:hypothetical protein